MKFTYIATGLMAALVAAQPITEDSSAITGELAPQVASEVLAERDLEKRSNAIFTVYESANCGGNGNTITASGSGAKGNFSPTQRSMRISQITNGWHLTLYNGVKQSGIVTRFTGANAGEACWTGVWMSYGLFSS